MDALDYLAAFTYFCDMKKFILTLAALVLGVASLPAQTNTTRLETFEEFNDIDLSREGSRIESKLSVAFPMYFGTSVLTNLDYKGAWADDERILPDFLDMQTAQNFVYGLEIAAVHIKSGTVDLSMGARWTFMDFTFTNPGITMRPELGGPYRPALISHERQDYDFTKSKIHANYFGIPLRVSYEFGKAAIFFGGSAEILVGGYTKYKEPKNRVKAQNIFNNFRATVEGGFSWGSFGLFVMYGLTPLFPDSLSDARTLSFGLIFGL